MPPTETPVEPTTPAVVPAPVAPAAPAPAVIPSAADQAAANAVAQAAAAAPPAAVTPPAAVEYALTLPKDSVLDASAIERTTAFAKAAGLAPVVAQKALDYAQAEVAADRTRQETAQAEAFKTLTTKTWVDEVKNDPTFGGEKFLKTVEDVKRAADVFLTADDREALNTSGWGNHPMLVRLFARIGKAMANDGMVTGGSGGTGPRKSDADVLYGSKPNGTA
jgi:hypothetical protein